MSAAKGFITQAAVLALVFCLGGWRDAAADTGGNGIETITDTIIHDCNACTLVQAQGTAQALGSGAHYVEDLSNNHIYLFKVDCEPGFNGALVCSVNSRTVPADVTQAFNEFRGAWLGNAQSSVFHGIVHDQTLSGGLRNPNGQFSDNGYINAYDSINRSSVLNGLLQGLEDPLTYSGFMAELTNALGNLPAPFAWASLEISVTIHFNDGSQRSFHYDKTTGRFVPVLNSAIDAHNNTLPEGPQTQRQTYSFPGLPNFAPYDSGNIIYLFPEGSNPDQLQGGCEELTFDGHALHCIHPF